MRSGHPSPEELVDPSRLLGRGVERPEGQTAAEQRAADLLRRVGEPTPPSPQALEAVESLVRTRVRWRTSVGSASLLVGPVGWAFGLILLVSSGAIAAWYVSHRGRSLPFPPSDHKMFRREDESLRRFFFRAFVSSW